MKNFFKVVFSRAVFTGAFIALQFAAVYLAITRFNEHFAIFYGVCLVLSAVVVVYLVSRDGNPAYKIAWIIPILALPVFGVLLYLVFGKNQLSLKEKARMSSVAEQYEKAMRSVPAAEPALPEHTDAKRVSDYLHRTAGAPVFTHTETTYLPVGEVYFDTLLAELEKAEKFIFMEYFIVEEGIMWDTILEILKRKVNEGVEVRFMYDGMCAFDLLPYSYPKKLQKFGIKCKMSNKIRPFVSTIQNNRDHRKICVIDGQTGYVGGVNLADEYINEKERFGHWKDTAVLLRGDAVQSLTMIFLQMWDVDMRGVEPYGKYLTKKAESLNDRLGYVIPYADSPFDHENVGEEVYFHILNHAKKYVHIMTPYLILDNEMLTTLIRAAKSGIEVIIIMPHIPDKWYAFAVAKTYYKELIEGGVQIYEYTPGFVHAKVFVSDDDTATVGSINLDFRSLYLHFENGVFIYDNPEVQKVEEDFQNTLAKCHKVTVTEVRNRGVLMKVAGQVLRLVAPLM